MIKFILGPQVYEQHFRMNGNKAPQNKLVQYRGLDPAHANSILAQLYRFLCIHC